MNTPPKKAKALDPVWLAVGICTGVAIGVATDQVAIWLPLGVVFCILLPSLLPRAKKTDD